MSAVKQYFQCRLQRGNSEMITWIEARGAKLNAVVELMPARERWTVAEVYQHGLPEHSLREMQRLHRKSLPSVEGMG